MADLHPGSPTPIDTGTPGKPANRDAVFPVGEAKQGATRALSGANLAALYARQAATRESMREGMQRAFEELESQMAAELAAAECADIVTVQASLEHLSWSPASPPHGPGTWAPPAPVSSHPAWPRPPTEVADPGRSSGPERTRRRCLAGQRNGWWSRSGPRA